MAGTGQATGAAKALCEVMGWDTDLGHSDGIPHGGQLAVGIIKELHEAGWVLAPTPALGVHLEPGEQE